MGLANDKDLDRAHTTILAIDNQHRSIEEYRPQLKAKITQIYNSKSDDKTENFEEIKSAILGLANDKDLDRAHTTILAIDNQGISIEELINDKELTKENIEEFYHDYLTSQDAKTLTDEQIEYLDESKRLSEAVIHYAKKHDIESDYAKQQDEAGNFTINEIHNYAESKGTSLEKITIECLSDKAGLSEDEQKAIDIMITADKNNKTREEALKEAGLLDVAKNIFSKIEDSSLNDEDKARLRDLIQGKMAFDDVSANENSTTLTEMLSDDNLKKDFESGTQSNGVKSKKIFASFNGKYGNLSPDEYADKVADLLGGLKTQKNKNGENSNIAFVFYGEIMQNATKEQKDALMKKLGASYYNIANVNNLDAEQTQSLSKKADGDLLRASAIFSNADDVHFEHTGALAQSKNADIGKLSVDRNNKVKDVDIQRRYLKNYENAISEVRAYGAENSYKLLEANQVFGLETFIKGDKMATDAANNSGVVAKMAAKNQTEAMNSIKNSIEDLWQGDDAISRLNNLSDQIKDCDSSNQLDMHKSFMSSEYSEVIEHAAGNIKNYDPSVQNAAMDSVYQTGNQKAIEAGYSGLVEKYANAQELPPGVQDILTQETTRAIFELVQDDAVKEFLDKFNSGNLSYSEIQKLPASKKREYYVMLFKQATPEEKLEFIRKIPNGTMKKSMLKMIAVTNPTFFNYMLNSSADLAENILEMNLNEGINNKIKNIAKQKGVSQNDFAEIKKDFEEKEYPPTAKTLNSFAGITVPKDFNLKGFDSKEIFPRDKFGNLLG